VGTKIVRQKIIESSFRGEILIDILAKSSSYQDLCAHLVHERGLERSILGAHLYKLNSRMELTLVASYGRRTSQIVRSTFLEDDSLASLGILEGKTTFVPLKTLDEDYYASVPFIKNMIPNGSLVLVNSTNSLENFFNEQDFKVFSKVASIMIEFLPTQDRTFAWQAKDSSGFLSDRQGEVLAFISQGLTNPQIARRLNLSESTIRHETIKIYRVLGVRNRAEALALHRG